jgi:hypothetical protein
MDLSSGNRPDAIERSRVNIRFQELCGRELATTTTGALVEGCDRLELRLHSDLLCNTTRFYPQLKAPLGSGARLTVEIASKATATAS